MWSSENAVNFLNVDLIWKTSKFRECVPLPRALTMAGVKVELHLRKGGVWRVSTKVVVLVGEQTPVSESFDFLCWIVGTSSSETGVVGQDP